MLPFSLFKARPKTPHELVKHLGEAVGRLEAAHDSRLLERASEECSKCLSQLKTVSAGDGGCEPNAEALAQLAQEAYSSGLLELLVAHLGRFDFEARKDAVLVFNTLVRRQIGTRTPTVEYICAHEAILHLLMRGYERQEVALNYGLMLRECLRHEALAQLVLHSPALYLLFDYVQLPTFDIASDAFATLKDVLTKHKMLVASFLVARYDDFLPRFNLLLQSENYVTRRQSLKLLGEILLDRTNFDVMTRYIANPEHLKLLMNLLRDSSKNIQLEAFHVFKIFVANPNKNNPIYEILLKNQRKLIDFLDTFQLAKDDEQFLEEKRFLVQQIQDLSPQRRDAHPKPS